MGFSYRYRDLQTQEKPKHSLGKTHTLYVILGKNYNLVRFRKKMKIVNIFRSTRQVTGIQFFHSLSL